MPEPLPPFSGDEPTCTKCGHTGASTQYREHGQCIHGQNDLVDSIGYEPNERLHRECGRCDFAWDEALNPPAKQPDPSDAESPYFSQLPSND